MDDDNNNWYFIYGEVMGIIRVRASKCSCEYDLFGSDKNRENSIVLEEILFKKIVHFYRINLFNIDGLN